MLQLRGGGKLVLCKYNSPKIHTYEDMLLFYTIKSNFVTLAPRPVRSGGRSHMVGGLKIFEAHLVAYTLLG